MIHLLRLQFGKESAELRLGWQGYSQKLKEVIRIGFIVAIDNNNRSKLVR